MAQYSIPVILDIARVSAYLISIDIAKGSLFGQRVDPRWPLRLFLVRRNVEWLQGLDATHPTLRDTANYLFDLCGGYAARALRIMTTAGVVPGDGSAGGGVVLPTPSPSAYTLDFEYLIELSGADFALTTLTADGRATRYDNPKIVGKDLVVMAPDIVQRSLLVGVEWQPTATGIEILIEGFDAATAHLGTRFEIFIKNPDLVFTPGSPTPGGTTEGFPYTFPLIF
jgi:hypothetical protein